MCGIFTQAVQDATQGFFTHFVCFGGNLDCTFGGCKRFVACQKSEAFGFFAQQHGSQIAMTDTYLTVVGHRTRNAECLQADADCFGSFGCVLTTFLDGDGATYNISPFGIFKTDGLGFFASLIRIETMSFADSIGFFDVFDTVGVQGSKNLFDTTVLAFKFYFSNHNVFPPYIIRDVGQYV